VADFEASDKLGVEPLFEPRQYDAVTCMFAIHYFCVSEKAFTMFLTNVASNLKDGGLLYLSVLVCT
jgi:mRNA (guanine-N7-)-methyltransferase